MSTKNHKIKAGLAALGLFWISAPVVDAQDAPPPPLPASPAQAPANGGPFTVLLLSNGRVIQGKFSEDAAGQTYVLHEKAGTIRFPRAKVEGAFASMADLYAYKLARLPAGDDDERYKLAKWCLEYGMKSEARLHLQVLKDRDPNDRLADRMIAGLDAEAQRSEDGRDPAVRVTSGEVMASAPSNPREINPKVPLPRGSMGRAAGRAVIFDLPPAVASKRALEFARYVHPVLQQACASCHNESYRGEFQLVVGKGRTDWTDEMVRANLDVALRLVNRDDPTRSDLLVYSLTAHGNEPRPVFHGGNDRGYRMLAIWVNFLRSNAPGQPVQVQTGAKFAATGAPGEASSERFGGERAPGQKIGGGGQSGGGGGGGLLPEPMVTKHDFKFNASASGVPADAAFPDPYAAAYALPILPGKSLGAVPSPGKPATAGAPANAAPGVPQLPPDDVIPPTNRKKKKTDIDPGLLEGVLKSRQGQP